MKVRQMNKILDAERPFETSRKVAFFWHRYKKACIYFNRISRKKLRKMKKEGTLCKQI